MEEPRRKSVGNLKTTGAPSVAVLSPSVAEKTGSVSSAMLGDLACRLVAILDAERQIYATLIDVSQAIERSLRGRQYETVAADVRRQERALERLADLERSRIDISAHLAQFCNVACQPVRLRDLYTAFPASLDSIRQQLQAAQPVLTELVRGLVMANRRNATLLRVALLRSQQMARTQAGIVGMAPGYTAGGVIPSVGVWQPVAVDRRG